MNPINAIIFDLGGVLLDINYQLTIEAFNNLGCSDFESIYTQQKQSQLFDDFETGKVSSETFRKSLQKQMQFSISNVEFDNAWNKMLLQFPKKRIELLEKLNKKFSLFLLSNTNEIHIKAFKKIISSSIGYERFENCFKKVYFSSEIGNRKPNASCFEMVLSENKLSAAKTLFIDDSIQHVEGAYKIGIKTLLIESGEELVSIFPDTIL
ncbi:MAG: HAD family phosphatase [Bacteroidota bacterium]|nr:HAD family phosphatase [Bacteroidota bacterium]